MPKILWSSPYSLIDKSSGASINSLYTLSYLKQYGFEVWSCSAFCCDNVSGSQEIFDLLSFNPQTKQQVFNVDYQGMHFVYTRCQSTKEFDMTLDECQLHYEVFTKVLDEFQPDFVIGYGLSPLAVQCRYEAQRRGIAVIQIVVNGEQRGFNFPYTDLLITDSFATCDYYAQKELINIKNAGLFFDPEAFLAAQHQPMFVTMINTSATKGVAIFAKLLSACEQQMPEVKFLGIETRAKFYQELERLHDKDQPQSYPLKGHKFKNLQLLPLQKNIKNVYAVTKVLLMPSLWFESGGRCSAEAVFNQIPVLSSKSGGIPEAFVGAGISLEAPEHCQQDYYSLPSDQEIQPWVDALRTMLSTDWSKQLQNAQKMHQPRTSTLRLLSLLHKLRPAVVAPSPISEPLNPEPLLNELAPCALHLSATVPALPTGDLLSAHHCAEHNSARTSELEHGSLQLLTNTSTGAGASIDLASLVLEPVATSTPRQGPNESSELNPDHNPVPNWFELEPIPKQIPEDFEKFLKEMGVEQVASSGDVVTAPATQAADQSEAQASADPTSATITATTTAPTIMERMGVASGSWEQSCNELGLDRLLKWATQR